MLLRQASLDDLGEIHRIRHQAILAVEPGAFSAADLRTWAERRHPDHFSPAVRQGRIVVAVTDGNIAGWAGREAEKITGLYVHPEAAGKGVGRCLMDFLERSIAADGHRRALLAASLNAVGFYQHLGYRKRRPQSQGGAFSMAKPLSAPAPQPVDFGAVADALRAYYRSPTEQAGITAAPGRFGLYTRNQTDPSLDSLLLDPLPADAVPDLADELNRVFGARPVRLYIDDSALEERLADALKQAGFEYRHTMTYLAHDGEPRPATQPDLPVESIGPQHLAEYAVAADKAFSDSETQPAPEDISLAVESLRLDLKNGHAYRLVRVEDEAAAVIGWHEAEDRLVFHLATRLPYRRRGLARALLGRTVAETYAQGRRSITVCTDPADGPLPFYHSLGFTVEVYRQARYLYRP